MGTWHPIDPGPLVVRWGLRLMAVIIVASAAGGLTCACGPVREGLLRVTPGAPDPTTCTEGAMRCNARVPEVCAASQMEGIFRWWPALPRRADGTQRVCSGGCALTDGGLAVCLAPDASTPEDAR